MTEPTVKGSSRRARPRGTAVAYGLIGLVVVIYAPMAIEYMWRFFDSDAPGLWNHAYAGVVGDTQAYGDGSVHSDQHSVYAEHRGVLLVHTTTGGLAIVGFLAQFSARLRRSRGLHRVVGRLTIALVVVSMAGSYLFLVLVGPDGIFDGPPFYLQLWGLATGTLLATFLAVRAIRRREVLVHQTLMAYAFALLLTAPLLRGLYLVLGLAWPEATQELTHLAGSAVLATWAPFGAVLASRSFDRRDGGTRLGARSVAGSGAGSAAPSTRRSVAGWVAISMAAMAVLVIRYRAQFDGLDRLTTVAAVSAALCLMTVVQLRTAARRQNRRYAAAEWDVHLRAILAAAPAYLVLWWLYDVPLSTTDAFNGAALTAPAMTLSAGLFCVASGRRVRTGRRAGARVEVSDKPGVSA